MVNTFKSRHRCVREMQWLKFMKTWLKDPMGIGSVAPTSKFVARRVIRLIPRSAKTIVEYGPGTGAVTIPLLGSLGRDVKLYAIEKNPDFVKVMQKVRDPRLTVVHGDALDVSRYCKNPDVILSALPFGNFPPALRHEILKATADALPPNGVFIIYLQYTRILEPLLSRYFKYVTHEFELKNIPPSHLFICRGPITSRSPALLSRSRLRRGTSKGRRATD
jgi:phosphatidylethanolamine/phosphatidyl-N-methylethanolamine N-methyltransferase